MNDSNESFTDMQYVKHNTESYNLNDIKHLSSDEKMKGNSRSIRNCIDVEFSHNEIIALWGRSRKDDYDHLIYRGEAWATPDEYLDLTVSMYIGVLPETIWEGGCINILIKEDCDNIVCELPKKKHNVNNYTEEG